MRTMATILAGVCAILASTSSFCQDTASEKKVIDYERRTWPAVSNGLLFVSGEFIPAPYVVSRNKNSIYINGRHVGTPGGWPAEVKPEVVTPVPPPADPERPTDITEKTSKYDDVYIKYIYEKRRYLSSVYGQEKGIDMMVDVYKSLPCIRDAKREDNSVSIIITWATGAIDHVTQVPFQRLKDNTTPEQAARMFDGICEIYSSGLEFNDYFIFGSVHRRGTQDGYGQFLMPIAEVLKAAKDEEDFVTVMTNKFPMVTGFSAQAFRSFYKHKDKLPQWEPLLQKRCKGIPFAIFDAPSLATALHN
jgi:hypothetical protein